MKFVKGREQLNRKLATLGPDMLNGPPDEAGFRSALLKKPTRTFSEADVNAANRKFWAERKG